MSKIGIQTWGTEGDIRPFIALALQLREAGHTVTLVVSSVQNKTYAEWMRDGLVIIPIGTVTPDMQAQMGSLDTLWQQRNPLQQLESILKLAFDPWESLLLEAAQQLVATQDYVIGHAIVYPLFCVAEQQQRPWASVMLQPGMIPSVQIPPEGLISLGKWGNRWLWKIADYLLSRTLVPRINRLRQSLGLNPIKRWLATWRDTPALNLLAYSAALRPAASDWPNTHHICGSFHLESTTEKEPLPATLQHFLIQEPAPVFIGLGSMIAADPSLNSIAKITRLFLEAVQQIGCRAIIQSRWDELPPLPLPNTIYPVIAAPHQAIFPHCAAIVHHGGAGTTQTAARAGCPMVIIAHVTDQFFWANMLYKRGVAVRPLQRYSLTTAKLVKALQTALNTPALQQNAQALAQALQQEHGTQTALDLIEKYLPKKD